MSNMFQVTPFPRDISQTSSANASSHMQGWKKNLDSFLDGKIADEQTKQAQQQSPSSSTTRPSSAGGRRTPSSAAGAARRSSARTDSPRRKGVSRLRSQDGEGSIPAKGADPDDFVIGDDVSDISRVGTPAPVKAEEDEAQTTVETQEKKDDEGGEDVKVEEQEDTPVEKEKVPQSEDAVATTSTTSTEQELPEDVLKRLAKLDSLTAKYQGMLARHPLHRDWHLLFYSQNKLALDLLRNYRTAHARVAAIEPFEATLREHTPLTSIVDPGALVEFLNQRGLQSEMVMAELKRLSNENHEIVKERDELKVKLDEAEKKTKEAFDEAAGLKAQREEDAKKKGVDKKEEDGDEFFSYDSEQPRLEEDAEKHRKEMQEQQDYINELSTENAGMRKDLENTKLDLSAMENKVDHYEREITSLKAEVTTAKEEPEASQHLEAAKKALSESEARLADLENDLKGHKETLDAKDKQLAASAADAEERLRTYQASHPEPFQPTHTAEETARKDSVTKTLLASLRTQATTADTARAAAVQAQRLAEGTLEDLKLELNRMTSEADNRALNVARLQANEAAGDTWRKRALEAEAAKKAAELVAETKTGHEAAAASLRAQLKRAVEERDAAYHMVIECSKCPDIEKRAVSGNGSGMLEVEGSVAETRSRGSSEAEGTEASTQLTEASTQATEVSTPTVEVDEADAGGAKETKTSKKRNKKKAKKAAQDAAAVNTESLSAAAAPVEATAKDSEPVSNPAPPTMDIIDPNTGETRTITMPPFAEGMSADDPMIQAMTSNPEMMGRMLTNPPPFVKDVLKFHIEQLQASQQRREQEDNSLQLHHEQVIETRSAKLLECERLLREKEEELGLKGEEIHWMRSRILHLEIRERDGKRMEAEVEGLREEVETLRESLADVGGKVTGALQEASEAREGREKFEEEVQEMRVVEGRLSKELRAAKARATELSDQQAAGGEMGVELEALRERAEATKMTMQALQLAKEACEKEIVELKAQASANGDELDVKHRSLSAEFEELRTRASGLESDLAASGVLAQERFKELSQLKEHVNTNLLPEVKSLKAQTEELKKSNGELEKSVGGVKKLEGVERDLKREVAEQKTQISKKDTEITLLTEKLKTSEARASALEDSYATARTDIESHERTRDAAVEETETLRAALSKSQNDLQSHRAQSSSLESQLATFRDDVRRAQVALESKTAQHATAQSLVGSLQDQSRELATQVKEVGARNEGLEDELADVRRALQERGQEGQTMRRLVSEAEGRADARIREMRERLEIAVEERDRAEEEATAVGRRRGREVEGLKIKAKEVEGALSRLREEKAEVEKREGTFKKRLEELEARGKVAGEEIGEVKVAMAQLRDSLDESEALSTRLEKEKTDLRILVDEREARLEKLQKSGKNMAEEIRLLKARPANTVAAAPSSRSSIDSSSRVMSPVPGSNGTTAGLVDYVYLKNVLLQFLEQKEKRNQQALVPVLGRLLHFDQADERRWMSVVAGR